MINHRVTKNYSVYIHYNQNYFYYCFQQIKIYIILTILNRYVDCILVSLIKPKAPCKVNIYKFESDNGAILYSKRFYNEY